MAKDEANIEPLFPGTTIMPIAPQIQAMYDCPRLEGIKDHDAEERRKFTPMFQYARWLQPADPPRPNESRYVLARPYTFDPGFARDPIKELEFIGFPEDYHDHSRWGGGLGFDFIRGRQTVRGVLHAKAKPPEFFPAGNEGYAIVSPRALKLIQDFGVDQLDILPINWTEDSDRRFEGYVFLDVLRLIDAYDYKRCELVFEKHDGRMIGFLASKRWFREAEIDPSIHLFHDFYQRKQLVMSRGLWRHLHLHEVRGLYAVDPANNESVLYHEKLARLTGGKK